MKKKFLFVFASLFVAALAVVGFSSFKGGESKAPETKAAADLVLYYTDPGWSETDPVPTGSNCIGSLKFCKIEITRVGAGGIQDDPEDITAQLELQYHPETDDPTTVLVEVNNREYNVQVFEKN